MSLLGDVALNVRKVAEEVQRLKAAYDKEEDDHCVDILGEIKRRLITFPTYLNPGTASTTRGEELMLTREALEIGVLVSARRKDLASLELYMNQLQVYYADIGKKELQESPRYMMLLGLNLIHLLVLSRIAQFHSELEKIPYESHAGNSYIRFAVLLERYLMEGSYNKLLNARKKAPSKEYISVVELLERTVRNEVAKCIPHAYTTLSMPAAQKVLMVASEEEVAQIGRDHGWQLSSDGRSFVFTREEDLARKEIPYEEVIKHNIQFAAEMQNIV